MMGALANVPNTAQRLAQSQAARAQQMQAYNQAMSNSTAQAGMLGTGYASAGNVFFKVCSTSTTTSTVTTSGVGGAPVFGYLNAGSALAARLDQMTIADGQACKLSLPDGTIIDVKANGSFEIQDKAAKVIYRANRVRDFNPFLNASDKIEEFIAFCGEHGVRQGEMLELPLNLFIGWLVLEAAKADREPEPSLPLLADLRKRAFSRCRSCGRFMKETMAAKKIEFCASSCFERTYQKALAA
jgi:hypothetical protein